MGPLSLEGGLACLRVEGSGHPSLFIGVVDRFPLWEHHEMRRESWEKTPSRNVYTQTHTQLVTEFISRAMLNEDSGCAALIMSALQSLPSSNLQSHLAGITERLLTAMTSRLPHTPLTSVPKQVANTTDTRRFVLIRHLCSFLIPLFLGKHFRLVLWWGR